MTTLTGRKPKDTYKDLLQVSNANSGVDDTPRPVEDGEGTASAIRLSTTALAVAEAAALLVGHTEAQTIGLPAAAQVLGTAPADAHLAVGRWSDDAAGARISLGKSRGAAIGAKAAARDGDEIGSIVACGDDGAHGLAPAARIRFEVAGPPGARDMPGRIVFATTADGASAPTDRARIDESGRLLINETRNSRMGVGITINQGANDDEILSFKSSDVAHGVTSVCETDTFASMSKISPEEGGLAILGLSEGAQAVRVRGLADTAGADTTKGFNATAPIYIEGRFHSGRGYANAPSNANVVVFNTRRSGDSTRALAIIDAEGTLHLDNGTAAFDVYDDAALLRALELERGVLRAEVGARLQPSRFDANRYDRAALDEAGLLGEVRPEDRKAGVRPLVNVSAQAHLMTGAIWQMHEMLDALFDTLSASDPAFAADIKAGFARRGLPTQILDWDGAIPERRSDER